MCMDSCRMHGGLVGVKTNGKQMVGFLVWSPKDDLVLSSSRTWHHVPWRSQRLLLVILLDCLVSMAQTHLQLAKSLLGAFGGSHLGSKPLSPKIISPPKMYLCARAGCWEGESKGEGDEKGEGTGGKRRGKTEAEREGKGIGKGEAKRWRKRSKGKKPVEKRRPKEPPLLKEGRERSRRKMMGRKWRARELWQLWWRRWRHHYHHHSAAAGSTSSSSSAAATSTLQVKEEEEEKEPQVQRNVKVAKKDVMMSSCLGLLGLAESQAWRSTLWMRRSWWGRYLRYLPWMVARIGRNICKSFAKGQLCGHLGRCHEGGGKTAIGFVVCIICCWL